MPGKGYGSEYHLRGLLAANPAVLSDAVAAAVDVSPGDINWLKYLPHKTKPGSDREYGGLEFLPADDEYAATLAAWRQFWPQTGSPPMWDAIGRTTADWLLVEAKANTGELRSPATQAKDASRHQIARAMAETKMFLGVPESSDWLGPYYQYANRLAVLYFLTVKAHIGARLLFVYFMGDQFPDGRPCPSCVEDWRPLIDECHRVLRLPKHHALSDRVHDVFVPVNVRP